MNKKVKRIQFELDANGIKLLSSDEIKTILRGGIMLQGNCKICEYEVRRVVD